MGGGYGGDIARMVTEAMAGMGDWFRTVGHRITHDPLWAGVTLVLVILMISLVVVQRRAG
jgi:hypothetical protein